MRRYEKDVSPKQTEHVVLAFEMVMAVILFFYFFFLLLLLLFLGFSFAMISRPNIDMKRQTRCMKRLNARVGFVGKRIND
ncbi:hypothetical protein CP533_3805 [Ophiocordyceps camponoti-saundersi (nom. inval.)]|nr:hypothetical protein CP533_3805 [Ophiocordyceps camponoti-saundersi (nom. inval.)]